MFVDDEENMRALIAAMLGREGYKVTTAASGAECLEKLKTVKPDLILLDVMMPDMSGWELFARIKKIKPNSKIMFLSILEISTEKLKEFKKAGLTDYIKKPFDRDDLINRVKKII